MRLTTRRRVLQTGMLLLAAVTVGADAGFLAAGRPPIRVLVVTGGHEFDRSFFALFDRIEDVDYTHVAHPAAREELTPERSRGLDAVVLYDLYRSAPFDERARADFVDLLERGIGLLVLHHALASHPTWPGYEEIVGGRYLLEPQRSRGSVVPASTYRHGVRFRVEIADRTHPITTGLDDFELEDEVYGGFQVAPGVRPLLLTAHPASGRVIGWARSYGSARVVFLQPGHGPGAYGNASYRRLIERSLRWVAGRLPERGRTDDEVLAGAERRIERYRTGPLVVRVVGEGGRPVEGAAVRIRQRRHEFLFGCNVFAHGRLGDGELENAYRDRFAALFNFATLPFYWGHYERKQGEPEHADRERVARWCRERGIVTKGHPLVWNHPASVPEWLPADTARIRALSDERVTDCARRLRSLIGVWDVVNEATDPWRFRDDNRMTAAFEETGVVDWTLGSFAAARRGNPEATLLINDYRTDREYEALLTRLVSGGRPVFDAIGIQSHMHSGCWNPLKVWEVCERFARFGAPLHFTETTIVSGPRAGRWRWGKTEPGLEERQAREVAAFYTVLFSHPSVEAITWWDLSDLRAWQGAPAGLLRRDLSPKPAYERLLDLVRRRWWTEREETTGADGVVRVRGFFGDYEVEAAYGGKRGSCSARHARAAGRTEMTVSLRTARLGRNPPRRNADLGALSDDERSFEERPCCPNTGVSNPPRDSAD